jgi:hypothetical protein
MHHRAWAPIAILSALSSTAVHADCAYAPTKQAMQTVDVVYLGRYVDLLGHPASFYFDPKTPRVIGPIDHDARKPAPNAKPGQAGRLTFRAVVFEPSTRPQGDPSVGFFEGFTARGAATSLAPIVPQLDPLALGLLAGDSPVAADAEKQLAALAKDPTRRAELATAMQGVIYAAPKDRAFALLDSYRYHDLFGGDPRWVLALKHEGLAGLAARAARPASFRQDWMEYLGELAIAWKAKPPSLANALDDLLLGQPTPQHPFHVVQDSPWGKSGPCGPQRDQIRGPFEGKGELSHRTVAKLLARVDATFAKRVEAAFVGVVSTPTAFVLSRRQDGAKLLVTAIGLDEVGVVEVDPALAIVRGSKLAIVSRGGAGHPKFPISHLAANESIVRDAGKATRVKVAGVDEAGLITKLRERVRSGNAPHAAGFALATLFDLAGRPGWSLDQFRAALWSLPGNVYRTPREWAGAWSEIFEHALRYSTNPAFATEVERAMPAIVQRFAHQGTMRAASIDSESVRMFVIEVGLQLALLRLRSNDLAGAESWLARVDGPLTTFATPRGAPIAAETARDSNRDAQLRITRAIVRGLAGKPADFKPANPNLVSFDVSIFHHVTRAYAPALRKTWQRAVVDAGYPEPRID